MYKHGIKRLLDFLASLTLLILLSPILLIVYIILYLANQGSPFFTQERPGYRMKPFKVLKFKTMNDKRDAHGNLEPDEVRLTSVGKWVRKLSLDELPQLINVLKGDMSLIGPRPWLMEYIPLMNDFQKRRHEVKPGISGWAQVNGRNTADWEQRFAYDVYYVENISFLLDLKIFILTIWNVLHAKGITAEGSSSMTKFKGNE